MSLAQMLDEHTAAKDTSVLHLSTTQVRPANPHASRWLTPLTLVLAVVASLAPAAISGGREAAKALLLSRADPDCAIAAAVVDDLGGTRKIAAVTQLAVAMPFGRCAGILGGLAMAAAPAATAGAAATPTAAPISMAGDPTSTVPAPDATDAVQAPLGVTAARSADDRVPASGTPAERRPQPIAQQSPIRTVLREAGTVQSEIPSRLPELTDPAYLTLRDAISEIQLGDLGVTRTFHPASGVTRYEYALPATLAKSEALLDILGLRLPTLAGDLMPAGVLAVHVVLPKTTGTLGPFVWARTPHDAHRMFGTPMEANYATHGYPPSLFAEIYLNAESPWGTPFRPTDRVGDFTGQEMADRSIRHGAVYVCSELNGRWRLFEYPDLPLRGDCANLVWPFNPADDASTGRLFKTPDWLRKEQTAHQVVSAQAIAAGEGPPRNIGPSVFFRTDLRAPESRTDLFVTAPFIYLDNEALLAELLLTAPLPGGTTPDPDQLVVAAGDLHYVSFGELRPLLDGGFGVRRVQPPPADASPMDFKNRANQVALYIGLTG